MSTSKAAGILASMSAEDAAGIMGELDASKAGELLGALDATAAAIIVGAMDSSKAAEAGLALPGVRLFTWTILAVIDSCFVRKINNVKSA
jgi:flagellar motility protein MotE (MotC chaperone)